MNLAGKVVVNGGDEYFLYVNDLKKSTVYLLISPLSNSDRISLDEAKDPIIKNTLTMGSIYNQDYLIGAIKKLKVSGRVSASGNTVLLNRILNDITKARAYNFASSAIISNVDETVMAERFQEFFAQDKNLKFQQKLVDGILNELAVTTQNLNLQLSPIPYSLPLKQIDFVELKNTDAKKILISTLKTVDYDTLKTLTDITWYEKDGKVLKDYKAVHNKLEFEMFVMRPLLLEIEATQRESRQVIVTLDTETTGLNMYNLSRDNEDKDHCVTVQLSWKDDQGVIIYLDMEHYDNVSAEYVAKRLEPLFKPGNTQREVPLLKPVFAGNTTTTSSLTAFTSDGAAETVNKVQSSTEVFETERTIFFLRPTVHLVGHNAMFDGKVMLDTNCDVYFNDDTLQMAFCLNPKTVRGARGLKNLTHRLLHHDTPELSTLLGKGNEDKFKYLTDETVIKIYGCADVDYTRKIFFILRKLMPDKLYAKYQQQDVPMLYILQKSEYMGMRTIGHEVVTLAKKTEADLDLLRRVMYQYVGTVVSVKNQIEKLKMQRKAGVIATDAEYKQAVMKVQPQEGATYEFDVKASEIRTVMYNILGYPVLAYTTGKKSLPKTDKYVMQKLLRKKKTDEEAERQKLLSEDIISTAITREEYNKLIAEGKTKKAKSYVLISAKELNKCHYPMALFLQKYAELNKEYTSYYKPIVEQNLEEKLFKNYSLARIETRRIMNPGQTMKGNLKALIRSYSDDYYLLDFDMSQAEYRIMLSLATLFVALEEKSAIDNGAEPSHKLTVASNLIKKMMDPENDYHTETAALVNGIPPYKVSKKIRKNAKTIGFGVPYGLAVRSLCEKIFGEINDTTLAATQILLTKWTGNNEAIMDYLNASRAKAFIVWDDMSEELRNFMDAWRKEEDGSYSLDENGNKIPIPLSKLENELGFYRTFDLTGQDLSPEAYKRRAKGIFTGPEGKISRPAGNYGIQSFAAELFRIILIRFYNRCEEEGIQDKIIWHMLIHDELLASVHKSLNPFYIYKLVKESCMVTLKGHTKYFVGINMGKTWGECKDDAKEAPVHFVSRMVKRWENGDVELRDWYDDPWEYIKPYREQYAVDRVSEVVSKLQPDIETAPVDIPKIISSFSNYTVRAMVTEFSPAYKTPDALDESEYETTLADDRQWVASLETWIATRFGEDKLVVDYDTKQVRKVLDKSFDVEEQVVVEDDYVDWDSLFEDDDEDPIEKERNSYFSFDSGEFADFTEERAVEFLTEEEERAEELYAFAKERISTTTTMKTTKYDNLIVTKSQLIIKTKQQTEKKAIKEYLSKYVAPIGLTVSIKDIFGKFERLPNVKEIIDFEDLDKFINSLRNK